MIPVYLSSIKSSGTYTFEFDKSQIVTTTNATIRLLIGVSKTGPFNTPVYCNDISFFRSVFGERDLNLERKGSYFHLFAEEMLLVSPIICLNLMDLDDTKDKTDFISYSTGVTYNNQKEGKAPLSGYFNTNKFWKLDTTKALKNINDQEGYNASLLNFINVGKKEVSIIATNYKIAGLDITARDWYGEDNIPEFMDPSDLINDYAVRINVIRGDYSNYEQLKNDPNLGQFFDSNGIKKIYTDIQGKSYDGLLKFLEQPLVVSVAEYIGVLIPGFVDKNNTELFIQSIVNLDTPNTGIYCAVDEDKFDGSIKLSGDLIDLIGGSIETSTTDRINYLSYSGSINETLSYVNENTVGYSFDLGTTATTATGVEGLIYKSVGAYSAEEYSASSTATFFDVIEIYKPSATKPVTVDADYFATDAEFDAFASYIHPNVSFVQISSLDVVTGLPTLIPVEYALVKDVTLYTDKIKIQINRKNKDLSEILYINGINAATTNVTIFGKFSFSQLNNDITGNHLFFAKDSKLGIDYQAGVFSSGVNSLTANNDTITTTTVQSGFEVLSLVSDFKNPTVDDIGIVLSHPINYYTLKPFDGLTIDLQGVSNDTAVITSKLGSINKTFNVTKINDYEFTIDLNVYSVGDIKPNHFLVRGYDLGVTKTNIDPITGKSRFTRIKSVKETKTLTEWYVTVKSYDQIYFGNTNDVVERYVSVQDFASNYTITALTGFTVRPEQLPNGTVERQNQILSVLTDTGLYNTLADKEAITWRYLVDSFEGTIEPFSKNVLSSLCKKRQFAFAILNGPSVKAFDESTNPLFKFSTSHDFEPRYIPEGGNNDFNPNNTFSLPTIDQGSNYCGFYHPNLLLREGSAVRSVPQSAYISNNYIAKYRNSTPYAIIAGPRRGVVSGRNVIGVEYVYDRDGLDSVEPFGFNVTIPTKGIGLVINANQTAQQNVKSALSSIHVRELLIYIEETVDSILKNYRHEFNTGQNRLEIKTLVDSFLDDLKSKQAMYDYETIMNTINNDSEIIDNDFGIIDIGIEPVRGMSKLVQRITILKTGGISRGEFTIG